VDALPSCRWKRATQNDPAAARRSHWQAQKNVSQKTEKRHAQPGCI